MSASTNHYNNYINSLKNDELMLSKIEKRGTSSEKPSNHLNLKANFYKKEIKKEIKDFTILNFIIDINERRSSTKTSLTNTFSEKINYELPIINKYEEKLNESLSFISDFDLEEDEQKNDSFKSSDDENSVEEIEIKTKTKEPIFNKAKNEEIELELEKEWIDIKQLLLFKTDLSK